MIEPQSNAMTGGNGPERIGADSAEEFEGLLPQSVHALALQENRVREFIRSHPLPVVLGALALGFVVARWIRED
jgi:hypothetical protein